MKAFKVLSAILILFLIAPVLLADDIAGYSDHILLFYPRSSTKDVEHAIDLSEAVSLTTMGNDPITFSEESTGNLSIFRIYDTLANDFSSVPTYNGYTTSNYTNNNYYSSVDYSKMFTNGYSVTLRIHTSGLFVKVDDPSVTRDFSLSCIYNEAHIGSQGNSFEICNGYKNIDLQLGVQQASACGADTMYSEFRDLGGGVYEIFVPSTPTVTTGNSSYYPLLLRLYDFCIKLEDPKPNERIEPGYYTTTITIESTTTYRNIIWKGTKTGNHIDSDYVDMQMSRTITVYGYVPGEGLESPNIHSMTISSSTDTYSMNLSDTSALYDIAKVAFHADNVIYSTDTGVVIPNTDENKAIRAGYYKIYITPNTQYIPGQTDYGSYRFALNRDPSETISYDLYLKTGSGGSAETAFKNVTSSTELPSSSIIGHAEAISNTVFCLVPRYTLFTEAFGSSQKKYTEFWDMAEVSVYLKVTDTSDNHHMGQYSSTIYFTLVSD